MIPSAYAYVIVRKLYNKLYIYICMRKCYNIYIPLFSTVPEQETTQPNEEAPETYIRQKRISKRHQESNKRNEELLDKRKKKIQKIAFKHAKKYIIEYRNKERDEIRLKRLAKATNRFYIPEGTKVVLVVRILGIMGVAPKVRKIQQLLRLRQINNATFVRVNKATMNMLIQVAPYVTWGAVNVKTVRGLLYKRGYASVRKQRIPITDNLMIANKLGKYGIYCMEDIVHEIVTCGPHFKRVNLFLKPFKLSTPTGGWKAKKRFYNEGGDAGDRKDMNALARKMI